MKNSRRTRKLSFYLSSFAEGSLMDNGKCALNGLYPYRTFQLNYELVTIVAQALTSTKSNVSRSCVAMQKALVILITKLVEI